MLPIFAALFKSFIELGRISARKPVQPVLIAACMTAIYAAVQPGGLAAGFMAAAPGNGADRIERSCSREQAQRQAELRQSAAADKLADQLLQTVPGRAPGAFRVWPSVFCDGLADLTGTGLLPYDATDAATRVAGPAVVDRPLSGSNDLLPGLIAGRCTLHRITESRAPSVVSQIETLSIHKTFGPVVAPSNGIVCMTPVHRDHASGRTPVTYGLQ